MCRVRPIGSSAPAWPQSPNTHGSRYRRPTNITDVRPYRNVSRLKTRLRGHVAEARFFSHVRFDENSKQLVPRRKRTRFYQQRANNLSFLPGNLPFFPGNARPDGRSAAIVQARYSKTKAVHFNSVFHFTTVPIHVGARSCEHCTCGSTGVSRPGGPVGQK